MAIKLSAAEIKTLEAPQTEQVKQALSLFLKELILLGWVNTRRGKRPLHPGFWLFLALTVGGFAIHIAVGIVLAIIIVAYAVEARKDHTMLFISPEGEQKLLQAGRNAPAIVQILKTVADARPAQMDHCTSKEWRKHLGLYYKGNTAFHQEFLLGGLIRQGLIEMDAEKQPQRTEAGDQALYNARTAIQKGQDLPRLLRDKSPNAAAMAAQLSGLVLLIPGIEGYFGQMFEQTGYLDAEMGDLKKRSEDTGTVVNDAGGTSEASPDPESADDQDSTPDNGADWQDDADFLDGIDADTGDTGVGFDGDGGGDGGDGGDGGGDGGCSGCGGGCGGD
ncbi:MAG: hypothetical protein IT261_06170 [Saprospiraceae bacterium]|nr:hypothetical protein [Saprospiraceae bacterium]